jgi:hypothetical protein
MNICVVIMMIETEVDLTPAVDEVIVKMIKQGNFGSKIFCLALSQGASEDVKRDMLTWLIRRGLILYYADGHPGKAALCPYIKLKLIDDFFRACCLFKNQSKNLPIEFILGRIHSGAPIIIKPSQQFIDDIRYDEAIRHTFFNFAFL